MYGRFFILSLSFRADFWPFSVIRPYLPSIGYVSRSRTVQLVSDFFSALGPWAQAIPRPFLSAIATVIYVVLAIVGANSFYHALDTLLIMLAYWLAIYCTIMIEEHLIFRHGSFANWNFADIDKPRKLPFGAAAFASLALGWVGAVLGMSSVWFVGPLALKISPPFGGDIGFELSMTFAGITYPVFRYFEKKWWKY